MVSTNVKVGGRKLLPTLDSNLTERFWSYVDQSGD